MNRVLSLSFCPFFVMYLYLAMSAAVAIDLNLIGTESDRLYEHSNEVKSKGYSSLGFVTENKQ